MFKGTDSIEEFLSFTKGLVNYLAIHGYMKPEMDSIRVRLLGHILTDKALRWFQQAINYGVDDQWSFEDAMVGLKRHFVKDASTRDAARKFEQLEQRSRSVPELRRELEQLGMQMVEAPTDYAMSRHFMDALKPEIASGVVMRRLTPEKSVFNEIVQKAIDVEEALFY